jgi:hypothetical protein
MITEELIDDPDVLLDRLSQYLHKEQYGRVTQQYRGTAKRFLDHLQEEGLTVYTVQPCHVDRYIATLRRQRKSSVRIDLSDGARAAARSAIHLLLRLIHGRWPFPAAPQSERDVFHHKLVEGYDAWLDRLRGLPIAKRRWRTCALVHGSAAFSVRRCASILSSCAPWDTATTLKNAFWIALISSCKPGSNSLISHCRY